MPQLTRLHNVFNIEKSNPTIEIPANITLTGNEKMFYINPGNISTSSSVAILSFFMERVISRTQDDIYDFLQDTINTLNEKDHNARIGFSKTKNGEMNTGHANREFLLDALSSEEWIYHITHDNRFTGFSKMSPDEKIVAADKFVKLLINFLYGYDGISADTINDLIIALEIDYILEYTKEVSKEMLKQGIQCSINKKGGIDFQGLSLIFIPQKWMQSTVYFSSHESKVSSFSYMQLQGMFKGECWKKINNNKMTKHLMTSSVNKLLNFDWNEKIKKSTWKSAYADFISKISGSKSAALFGDLAIISVLKEWFDETKDSLITLKNLNDKDDN